MHLKLNAKEKLCHNQNNICLQLRLYCFGLVLIWWHQYWTVIVEEDQINTQVTSPWVFIPQYNIELFKFYKQLWTNCIFPVLGTNLIVTFFWHLLFFNSLINLCLVTFWKFQVFLEWAEIKRYGFKEHS